MYAISEEEIQAKMPWKQEGDPFRGSLPVSV